MGKGTCVNESELRKSFKDMFVKYLSEEKRMTLYLFTEKDLVIFNGARQLVTRNLLSH